MPRAKKPEPAQQVYKLPAYGPLAVVTIDYDANNPPPFFQPAPNTAVIGEHQCAPALHDANAYGEPHFAGQRESSVPRGGNFGVAENDPAFLAFKQGLGGRPAEPGISLTVLTSEQVMGVPAGTLAGLLDAAPPVDRGEEN